MKKAYIIALIVIVAASGLTIWSFSSGVARYVDIRTARKSDTPVQVWGKILHDTARYDPQIGALRFQIQDKNGDRIEVIYHGAKPDAFDTAPETAALGIVRDGVFLSDSMVVKCPSKYDDKSGGKNSKADSRGGKY